MRSAFIFLCLFFTLMPINSAEARTAMNRCFDDFHPNEAAMFSCMKKEYDKREDVRKVIEEEILGIVSQHEYGKHRSRIKEADLEGLIKGRQIFEDYRELECDRQKRFLDRNKTQGTFEFMVCLYDMTTQRIRTLQNSVKE